VPDYASRAACYGLWSVAGFFENSLADVWQVAYKPLWLETVGGAIFFPCFQSTSMYGMIGQKEVFMITEELTAQAPNQKIYNKFISITPVEDFAPEDIKALRQKLGLSQSMLGNILGVHKRAVEAWEIGRKNPNGSARRLMTILQADPDAIQRNGIAEW